MFRINNRTLFAVALLTLSPAALPPLAAQPAEADALQLSILESADPVQAGLGKGNLTYLIKLTNSGTEPVTGITLGNLFNLPSGVQLDTITPSAGRYADSTWLIERLAPQASALLTVTLTVTTAAEPGIDAISTQTMLVTANNAQALAGMTPVSEMTSIINNEYVETTAGAAGAGAAAEAVSTTAIGETVAADTFAAKLLALPAEIVAPAAIIGAGALSTVLAVLEKSDGSVPLLSPE